MKVYVERSQEFKDVKASSVADMLKELQLNPSTVLVTRNDVLVPEDELLAEDDDVKILSVISGG